jgi:Metallo-peptidase family M12
MSLNETTRSMRSAMGVAALILFATSSFAATVTKLNEDALAPLREATVMRKIRIDKLPLFDSKRSVIDLEEFQVWEPGAKVIIHGDNGVVLDRQDPPPMRFFRGLVNGDPDSFAYFSIDGRTGSIQGLIVVHDRKFSLDSVRRGSAAPRPRNPAIDPAIDETATDRWDEYLAAFDHDDEMPTTGQSWQCEVDKMRITPEQVPKMLRETTADGTPIQAQSISGTQQYGISVVVETDYELWVSAGSDPMGWALISYVTNLSGAVSTIYNRDIHTNLTQQAVHIYTSSSDPWSAATASAGLTEIGDYYHANYPSLKRSAVVMLSGKPTNSGIAWEGIVCNPDFANGADWGGAYAWCGSISNGTIPDPNATVATHLYGMPSSNYWPLAEYAHELGHILGGHHTHCIALTLAEQTATGRSYVDTCYNAEPAAGCFSGTPAGGSCDLNGFCSPAPSELGTVMSYCHNIFVSGVPQSRYTFGQASEVSRHQQDDYLLNAAGPGSIGYLSNIVTQTASLTMSAISAPASVTPSSTGNIASISVISGATYAWTASGGTITSATTGNSITFTAGASGTVSLRATAYGTNSCGVTDTKSVTITTATYNPPTNVEAHATSTTNALVSWVAPVAGTTPGRYNVYRSSDGVNYTQRGNTTGASFNDTVSNNTAYVYKVRSADSSGNNESTDSNRDLATIVIYTNLPVTAVVSTIKAVDLNELRTAVDAVRSLDGIGAGSYTYGTGSPVRIAAGTAIHAADINELRTNLNTAINALFGTTPTYFNTITAPSSTVQAIDFNELRNVMR